MSDIPNITSKTLVRETCQGGYSHLFLSDQNDFLTIRDYLFKNKCITAKLEPEDAWIKEAGLYRIILDGNESAVDQFLTADASLSSGIGYLEISEMTPDAIQSIKGIYEAVHGYAKVNGMHL